MLEACYTADHAYHVLLLRIMFVESSPLLHNTIDSKAHSGSRFSCLQLGVCNVNHVEWYLLYGLLHTGGEPDKMTKKKKRKKKKSSKEEPSTAQTDADLLTAQSSEAERSDAAGMPSNSPEQVDDEPADHLATKSDGVPSDSTAAAAIQRVLASDSAAKQKKQRKGTEAADSAPRAIKPVAGPQSSAQAVVQPKPRRTSKAAAADHAGPSDAPGVSVPSDQVHQAKASDTADKPAAPTSEVTIGKRVEPVRRHPKQQKGKDSGASSAKSEPNAGPDAADPAAANEATAATPKAAAAAGTARKTQSAVDRRKAAMTKQKEQQVRSAHFM